MADDVRSPTDRLRTGARRALIAPIVAYRRALSPMLPRRCRYEPTCSAYAIEAIRQEGAVRGLILAAWRLVRCNPLSHGGHDPVEAQTLFHSHRRGAAA